MKDKTSAGLLALFLGALGVHRFYLGQKGLGFLYIFLIWGISPILGLIDAIIFLTMDQETFDEKYNNPHSQKRTSRRRTTPRQRQRGQNPQYIDHRKQSNDPRRKSPVASRKKKNPFKLSGIQKYKDYDFEGSIEDFKKALAVDSRDVAVHFNLACAYSITENAEKSLFHLNAAVDNGFVDFDKIKEHDALAYLRIQDEFDEFVKNNYQLDGPIEIPETPTVIEEPSISTDLLEQIKKLGELREKGFLTEEEFAAQKRRLLK